MVDCFLVLQAVEGSLIASNVIRPGTARLLRPRVPNAVSVRRARLLTVQHPPMPRQMIKSMSPEVPAERPPAPRLMETVTEHTESQRHTDPARPKVCCRILDTFMQKE